MRIRDIDLNHFNIKLERKRIDGTLGKISIKSKEEFANKYKNLLLDYDFQTELWIKNADQFKNVAVSNLTDKEQISIKQSIVAKLNKALKARKNSISKTIVDDFDFSEFDELEKTEQIPMLTDFANKVEATESKVEDKDNLDELFAGDFDFDDLDTKEEIAPNQPNDLNLSNDFDFEDAPVIPRSIDDMLTSLVDSRQKLNVSYQTIGKLLDEIKRVEENHKSIEATVDDLERELFNALQKKHK